MRLSRCSRRIGVIGVAMAAVVLAGCASATGSADADPAGPAPDATLAATGVGSAPAGSSQLLYVLTGEGTVADGRITVADGEATWITDRPDRSSGRLAADRLVTTWAVAGFDEDPPNAVLTTTTGSTAVELTAPAWDAATSTVSFAARPIGDDAVPLGVLGPVELFIDEVQSCATDDVPDDPLVTSIQIVIEEYGPEPVTLPSCAELYSQAIDLFDTNPQPQEPPSSFSWLDQWWTCDAAFFFPETPAGPIPVPQPWFCTGSTATLSITGLPA